MRAIEPRLSLPAPYQPVPSAPQPPSDAVLELAERAAARVRHHADARTLHAAALVDLLWAGTDGIPLDRSISYLRTVSRLEDRSAAALTDLAAALIVRAERKRSPRDLLEAIESADRALELEPRDAAARFDLALALERFGIDAEAERAWKMFLEIDSTSGWATEAKRHRRPPAEAAEPPPMPAPTASLTGVLAYADAAPEQAMLFGWDHLLDEWGSAVAAGDMARADRSRRLAAAVGAELERQHHDATLADAVRAAVLTAGHASTERALARAHRDYAAGRAAHRGGTYAAAGRWFDRVIANPSASPPLVAWARFGRASTLVYQGRPDAADAALRQVLAYANALRDPSLAARAHWVLATTLLRRGRHQQAIDESERGAELFQRIGEEENLGAVEVIAADAEQYLADPAVEYAAVERALITLRPYRRSVWLHVALYNAGSFAATDGLRRAAVKLADEDVRVATETGERMFVAEARLGRARLLAASERASVAAQDVGTARAIVQALPPSPGRNWFDADLRLAEAATILSDTPVKARAALDSVIAFFRSQHNQIRLLPALVARSRAALDLGDGAGATADLDRSLTILNEQSSSMTRIELRASLLETARSVVDRLVMRRVAAGQSRLALADLERARVSLAPTGARNRARVAPLSSPPRQVAAEYALVGDTLLIWTIVDAAVELSRTTVDRAQLLHTIEQTRTSLELRSEERSTTGQLTSLYDWLVRPIEPRLGQSGATLVLVAAGDLAGVPFAALRDSARGRYLIEDHPLRFVPSLRDAGRAAAKRPSLAERALLVADPEFDRRAFPELRRLPGASAEVEALRAEYPDAVVLSGPAANRVAVEAALQHASVVHYAGHAVFDDERPEQSLLVLASAQGQSDPAAGRITAEEIERLRLGHLRLVVLSACETIRSRSAGSGGFGGLADALLAAGAQGVVGSLWRVDDELTRELMSELHRAYGRSGNGAEALRAAQLRLLRSADSKLSSPAAWAAFRYAGN